MNSWIIFRRLLFSIIVVASAAGIVLFLTLLGAQTTGPLDDLFSRLGSGIREMESWVYHQVRGPGRSARLSWFAPYRENLSWLKQPEWILLGAYDDRLPRSLEGVHVLEVALDTAFPLIHFYTAWGDKPEQQFPQEIVEAIWDYGSVPVITWEPWLSAFDGDKHPHLPPAEERDRGGLARVAAGDYDFYLIRWAQKARQFARPLFVRLAHEMNDPYRYPWGPQNNAPEDFIRAWKHVVSLFRQEGASNVIWVWSPHPAYGRFREYFPGSEVVDWVGGGALNYGTVAFWSRWWTFEEIFGQYYDAFAQFGKPVMITEFNSLAVGGDRAQWFREALADFPDRYPQVRSVLFFHSGYDPTVTYKPLDWSIIGDSLSVQAIRQELQTWDPVHLLVRP